MTEWGSHKKFKITAKDRRIDSRNLQDYEDDRDKENLRHKRELHRIHKKYEITPEDRRIDKRNGRLSKGW